MTSTTSQEVLERLHALMSQFKRRMHQAVRDEGDGLAPMEARALAYFARQPGHTQSELVQHAGRDKAQIARIVKQLLDRDLLRSEPDPADGRSQLLYLTESGRAMQRVMDRHRKGFEADLLAGLSASERSQLLSCLDRMLAGVRREGP
jgi:DNA-binding MarR family transcriptional regulator